MSLQVWLPLNGNLNNYGLSDVTVTNNGATVDNNGKIGKCYSFNGTNNHLKVTKYKMVKDQNYSISFWAKCNTSNPVGCVFSNRTAVDSVHRCIFLYGTKTFYFDEGNRWTASSSVNYDATKWTHYVFIKNGTARQVYINGQLAASNNSATSPVSISDDTIFVGESQTNATTASGNSLNGQLNDYRIYDHALSKKEIKELSKGLCLHYKLNSSSENLLGNSNLIINTPLIYTYAAKHNYSIDTNFKNNLKDILLYAYQNNLGFTLSYDINVPRCWPNSANNYNRCGVYWGFSVKDNTTGTTSNWYGNHSGPNTATSKHNFSIGTNSLNAMTASATSTNPDTRFIGHYSCTVYPQNQTNATMKGFYTNPNNYTLGTPYLNAGITGYSVDEASITNIKLELGNDETPWCPNISDAEYTIFKTTENTEYDCSGFSNNGTKNGTITSSVDSPRNSSCLKLSPGNIIGPIPNTLKPAQAITMALWVKLNAERTSSSWELTLFNNYEGGGAGLDIKGANYGFQIYSSGYKAAWTDMTGKMTSWHHFVGTFDGSNIKTYIDGELKATTAVTANSVITYQATTPWAIGVNPGPSGGSGGMNGWVSDARIYATALSDDDILELYEVGGSIAKGNTVHAYEFIE